MLRSLDNYMLRKSPSLSTVICAGWSQMGTGRQTDDMGSPFDFRGIPVFVNVAPKLANAGGWGPGGCEPFEQQRDELIVVMWKVVYA
ncbi:hypothetical protein SUGI_0135380 [Cryptomeria japonica]|nr:hypothetical protein SUGI_0135380 [Cryptomeria japonica]